MKYVYWISFFLYFTTNASASISSYAVDDEYYKIIAAAEACESSMHAALGHSQGTCGLSSDAEHNYYEYHWSEYSLQSDPTTTSIVNEACEQLEEWHAGNLTSCLQHNFVTYLEKNQCVQAGNPINVLSGTKYQREVDYRPGNRMFMPIVRTYKTGWYVQGRVGGTWEFNTASKLVSHSIKDGRTDVLIFRSNGQRIGFIGNVTDGFSSDPDVTESLTQENGQWLLRLNNDTVERYDFNGRLSSVKYRTGYQLNYHYEDAPSVRLLSINDTLGRSMSFTYQGGALIAITDLAGQVYRYTYNNQGMIDTVIYPDDTPNNDDDNPRKRYHYEIARTPNTPPSIMVETFLTGITDENGDRHSSWTYNSLFQAVSSEQGDGADHTELNYAFGNRKVTVTNAKGKSTTYHYTILNGSKLVTHVEGLATADCAASSKTTGYDPNGFPNARTDRNGNTTYYAHNTRGLEISRTESVGTPEERTITTDWHDTYHLPTKITAANLITHFEYDANGRLTNKTETDTSEDCEDDESSCKRITRYTYNNIGQILSIDGPRTGINDTTYFEYDLNGNRIKTINALGHVTEITAHDGHGNPLSITGPNGDVTTFNYDARQRLISRTIVAGSSLAATTYFEYDAVGNLTKLIHANGNYLIYRYDAAHRLTGIEDNAGNAIHYYLDEIGNRTATNIQDPQGNITQQQSAVFDSLGRLIQSISASNETINYGYDLNDNMVISVDAKNHPTQYQYDSLNRLVKVIDPLNSVINPTTYQYNDQDNLTQVTDPTGLITTYDYNGFGEVIRQYSPDTGLTTFRYDEAGNRISQTDARGVTVNYEYDALNRLVSVTNSENSIENITYVFDSTADGNKGVGRLTQTQDQSGISNYQYDLRGHLIAVNQSVNIAGESQTFSKTYSYDAAGQLTQMTYPSGRIIEYLRNPLGQITQLSTHYNEQNKILASTINYLPFANKTSMQFGNGLNIFHDYDLNGRLNQHEIPGVQNSSYDYDANYNVSVISNNFDNNDDHYYAYDELNRLITVQKNTGSIDYSYDNIGNRLQKTVNQITNHYQYNDENHHLLNDNCQIPCDDDEDHPFQYDESGNLIKNHDSQFSYNQQNRLSSITTSDGITQYSYNNLGQRTAKYFDNGNEHHYIYDQNGLLIAEIDNQNRFNKEYIYLNNQPLSMVINDDSGTSNNGELIRLDQKVIRDGMVSINFDKSNNGKKENNKGENNGIGIKFLRLFSLGSLYDNNGDLQNTFWNIKNNSDDVKTATLADDSNGFSTSFTVPAKSNTYVMTNYAVNKGWITLLDSSKRIESRKVNKQSWVDSQLIEDDKSNTSTSHIYYYHNDHLGTPQLLTDQNQNTVWQADYHPFGKAEITVNTIEQNLRFPGQYYDSESGLHYNYFRYYDPNLGRYITSDPIGLAAGVNTYGYVIQNPVNFTDPFGLLQMSPTMMATQRSIGIASRGGTYGAVAGASYAVGFLVIGPVIKAAKDSYSDNVIPFPVTFPNPIKTQCSSDDTEPDDTCEQDRIALLHNRQLIINMRNFINNPQSRIRAYRQAALIFNQRASTHNTMCPAHQVPLLPLGPNS